MKISVIFKDCKTNCIDNVVIAESESDEINATVIIEGVKTTTRYLQAKNKTGKSKDDVKTHLT